MGSSLDKERGRKKLDMKVIFIVENDDVFWKLGDLIDVDFKHIQDGCLNPYPYVVFHNTIWLWIFIIIKLNIIWYKNVQTLFDN